MADTQFEVFERTIPVGATMTIEASRQPERWLVYPSSNAFSGNIAVLPGGSIPASGAQRLFAYTRLVVPGISSQITVRNESNMAAPLVLSAVSGLPLEIERLAQGGEQGNPDRGGRMRNGTDYTVGNAVESFWTLDTVDYDTDNMCSVSPNNRLVVHTPGKYLVYAHVVFFATWAKHYLYLWRNQTQILDMDVKFYVTPNNPDVTALNVMSVFPLAANDYIQAVVYQATGNTRSLRAYPYYSGILGAQRLAG